MIGDHARRRRRDHRADAAARVEASVAADASTPSPPLRINPAAWTMKPWQQTAPSGGIRRNIQANARDSINRCRRALPLGAIGSQCSRTSVNPQRRNSRSTRDGAS